MTVYKRAIRLMEAELGDDLVALDPAAGECFGFNSVAASVWRELDQPKNLEQLRDALLQEYQVEPERCSRELKELLHTLVDRGLVDTAI
jgi:hypothetical protein